MAHNPHSINRYSFRTIYLLRFITRAAVFAAALAVFFLNPNTFDVILGKGFFKGFSACHLLWAAWMFDMVMQLIPSAGYWPLGSQKYFGSRYVRISDYINKKRLMEFVRTSTRDAYYIAVIWILITAACAVLYRCRIIDHAVIMLIVIGFYLCDVICVYFWCPFRVFFMKNRCCTTCRIFNWDHLMMFAPFLFIPGVFTWSLCIMAIIIFLAWEITFFLHPERFWTDTNNALACKNCSDELCGRKLMITEDSSHI